MNTCNTCHWFKPHVSVNEHYNGECERHAPIAAVVRDFVVTIRPSVAPTDRCGEWAPKDLPYPDNLTLVYGSIGETD